MKKILVTLFFIFKALLLQATSFITRFNDDTLTLINAKNNIVYLQIALKSRFIEANKQTVKTKYAIGSFSFKTKNITSWQVPQILSIDSNEVSLTIHGILKNQNDTIPFKLYFNIDKDEQFRWYAGVLSKEVNHIKISFFSNKEEQFLGFGEQYSHVNFKGKSFATFSEEQGIGRGDAPVSFFTNLAGVNGNKFTTYCAIPYTLTNKKRAILVENKEYIHFNLKNDNSIEIASRSNIVSGIVYTGNPKEITKQYTAYTGRMPALPDWAFGSILGLQGGKEKVKKIVTETQQYNNPVSAVWIQDWVGKRATKYGSRLQWQWLPDTTSYGNMKKFIEDMNALQVKVLGYINPFLAETGPLTNEALEKNYVIKNREGQPYLLPSGGFNAYMVDLSNPKAFNWLKQIIKTHLIGNGFSGWMADFSEALPLDAVLYNKADAASYHNFYMVEWARLNREAIRESDKEKEILFFNRAGYTGSAKYSTLFWAGDQMVSWQKNDGLPTVLNAMLSSGLSGISLNHSDIGGYTSVKRFPVKYIRNKKLLFRWIEMNTFSAFFRTHEGLHPNDNYQFYTDSSTQHFFAKFANIHFALKKYLQHCNQEATEKGYPIIRNLYFKYPEIDTLIHEDKCFLLGEDILVAPVLSKNDKVNFTLPKGQWQHVWNKHIINVSHTKNISATVPLGYPEVYVNTQSAFYAEIMDAFNGNR